MDKGQLLETWKEIAAHLNHNVRTCQMWERDLGLPVHRLDGTPKARVFAYRDELDNWLREKLSERETGARRPRGKRAAGLPTLPRWSLGLIVSLSLVAVAAVAAAVWLLYRQAKLRWVNDIALPEVEQLLMTSDNLKAFDLLRRVEVISPENKRAAQFKRISSGTLSVETEPPGADLTIRPYGRDDLAWQFLGRTPVSDAQLAKSYQHWRLMKTGYVSAEGGIYIVPARNVDLMVKLDRIAEAPEGMVRVAGGPHGLPYRRLESARPVKLEDFFMDKFEVTNRQFQAFVDTGGYRDRRLWRHQFQKDGRTLSWEEAMPSFVDRTGSPGPAGWEQGRCPPGLEDLPVTGVSWYEAAAYAAFAGKRLPSLYHWDYAAGTLEGDFILPLSNVGGRSLTAVGTFKGLGPFGTYDMIGNAREWCSNDFEGKKACLGGAWDENVHGFMLLDPYPPFMRAGNFGFRCMKDIGENAGTESIYGRLKLSAELDYSRLRPCSDDVFEAYRALYSYTKTPLEARLESREDWSEDTVIERVSFADAEGSDRVIVYLFLPRNVPPPWQCIVYFPGGAANVLHSVLEYARSLEVEFFTGNGRAFVFPVFWSTFERRLKGGPARTRQFMKDRMIRHHRELGRTLDYLETRPDINQDRIAYQGLSWGAWFGPLHVALEKRFKAANFQGGGSIGNRTLPSAALPSGTPPISPLASPSRS